MALKLIVDREREIEAFIPEEYFEIDAYFIDFSAKLDTYNHKKIEIKKEVEAMYNVTVLDVNTMRYAGKTKSRYTKTGLVKGRNNAFKKAIVTLKKGDTIDFYSNI